jgi:predicted amidophosphoribosyltransferase
LIFRQWAKTRGWAWQEDVLTRLQPTMPQYELDLAARRRNIKGAFQVTRREIVQGKRILLVDDIVTTGATMQECAVVLKRAGAAAVYGLALASGAQ